MKRLLLACICILSVCGFRIHAQTIYSYTSATAGSPNAVAANATGGSLTRVNGATAPGSPCGTGFSSTSFSSTTTFSTSLAAVSVTVKPNAGYKLTIASFNVGIRRSGTGPANNRLAYSIDGGTTWINKGSDDAPSNSGCGSVATASWDPTDFDVTSTANGIIFRIFGFGASSTGGTYQIMNLNINGTVVAVSSCGNPSGLVANNITNTTTDLSWNAVTGATGYEYTVNQTATDPVSAGTPIGNTTATVASLTPNATHYLHVRTVCGASFSAWVTVPFITLACYNVVGGTVLSSAGNSFCLTGSSNLSLLGNTSGTGISYQWKSSNDGVLWNNVGTNSSAYATGTLNVTTYFKAFVSCTASGKVDSTEIDTIKIENPPLPQVTIAALPGNTICAGTAVNFSATQLNAGTTPTYAWYKNNMLVGTNSNTYTDNSLNDNDDIFCIVTSSEACVSDPDDTSSSIVMTVNSLLNTSATISATPGSTICDGTNTTFTVLPVNGGTTPTYQWKVNGVDIPAANAVSYVSSTLANNDKISCVVTSNALCPSPASVNSDTVTMTVNPILVPSVTIGTNPGNTICAGTSVMFTAIPANAGTIPVYQWKKNNVNVGTNTISYTDNSLSNGDIITVVMTSNAVCATPAIATSNAITMTVNALITPTVSTSLNPGNTICAATSVTFTAIPVNGGTTPVYQWKKDGINVGTNNIAYTDNALTNGNVITVVMTSNAGCLSAPTATSTGVTMTVNPILAHSATISALPGNVICNGISTTFTVLHLNGGTTPAYQWRNNGTNIPGATAASYTSSTLANSDKISCAVISNAVCPSPATVNSDTITMTVNPIFTPSVAITANPGNVICNGELVTFSATTTNGGTTPSYQWKKNGSNVGSNSNTYVDNALTQADVLTCALTSSETCVTNAVTISNAINMTVNQVLVPTVSLALSPNDTICAGTTVNFTTTNTNPGTSPTYTWRRNSSIITGATNSSYSASTFNSGDVISVTMTSNAICANPANAMDDTIIIVNPLLLPQLSIFATPDTTICAGTLVTFGVQTVNAGTNPQYQWKLNGIDMVGATSASYMLSNLNNGNVVSCNLTSNAICATPATVSSANVLNFVVNPTAAPIVNINATPGVVVKPGEEVTFNATVLNSSTNPIYKWYKNGVEIAGAITATYKTKSLNATDEVYLVVYSSEPCAQPDSGKSNSLIFTITNSVRDISTSDSQFEVYPNPNNGKFYIFGNAELNSNVRIQLVDNLGRLVFEDSFVNDKQSFKTEIAVNAPAAGNYYLKITADGKNTVKKLTIRQ
jgi:hypothetical protein